MVDHLDDIIKGCITGKRDAQAKLYNMFSNRMYAVCLYYSKDQTEAEDMMHEGFIKVFKNISQYKGEGSFEGWMRRIMVNTSLEKYRRQSHLYPVDNVFDYFDDRGYEDIISQISFNDLLSMIRELPPQYRLTFNLYVMEDMPHKEIGKVLGISEGTSKSNLSRARTLLQEKVKRDFGIEGKKKKMVI